METKKTWTRDEIAEAFKEKGTLTVTFTKKNGELRTMVCTTNLDEIPKESHPKGKSKPNPAIYNVWDVEAGGWRCFKIESIISVE